MDPYVHFDTCVATREIESESVAVLMCEDICTQTHSNYRTECTQIFSVYDTVIQ